MQLCARPRPAGKIYALKQMSKAHIIDNKLVAHVHREKNVSGRVVCSALQGYCAACGDRCSAAEAAVKSGSAACKRCAAAAACAPSLHLCALRRHHTFTVTLVACFCVTPGGLYRIFERQLSYIITRATPTACARNALTALFKDDNLMLCFPPTLRPLALPTPPTTLLAVVYVGVQQPLAGQPCGHSP